MQIAWLSVAILCTVGYHLVLKLTPAGVNPLLSLMLTYALVTLSFGVILLLSPGGLEWRHELRQLNWTVLALAVAIVGLDLAFMFVYRSGFEVSLGALVTHVLVHEIGHHFGLSDEDMEEIERNMAPAG